MNIRLLIIIIFLGLASCRLSNETMSYEYRNMSFDAVSDTLVDKQFDRLFSPYKDSLGKVMSVVIGHTANPLIAARPESPLSNLISDMTLNYATQYCRKKGNEFLPSFSLINHGSLRISLPKGAITMNHAYELMPFENELVLLKLNGKQVIELANYIATRGGEGVSGISFGIAAGRAESIMVQGMRIDEEKKYWMVTSDYIANGGDGMKVLTWAEEKTGMDVRIRDMIIEVFSEWNQNNQLIDAKNDRRLYHGE
jgi:2',3'-cyclic-nucleotide 2'-phosphodiesterase (5'-nucleotidase family)